MCSTPNTLSSVLSPELAGAIPYIDRFQVRDDFAEKENHFSLYAHNKDWSGFFSFLNFVKNDMVDLNYALLLLQRGNIDSLWL